MINIVLEVNVDRSPHMESELNTQWGLPSCSSDCNIHNHVGVNIRWNIDVTISYLRHIIYILVSLRRRESRFSIKLAQTPLGCENGNFYTMLSLTEELVPGLRKMFVGSIEYVISRRASGCGQHTSILDSSFLTLHNVARLAHANF